jgi:hypothetical protein
MVVQSYLEERRGDFRSKVHKLVELYLRPCREKGRKGHLEMSIVTLPKLDEVTFAVEKDGIRIETETNVPRDIVEEGAWTRPRHSAVSLRLNRVQRYFFPRNLTPLL